MSDKPVEVGQCRVPPLTARAELGCLTLDKSCGSEKEFMVIKTEVFVLGQCTYHHQLMVNLKRLGVQAFAVGVTLQA